MALAKVLLASVIFAVSLNAGAAPRVYEIDVATLEEGLAKRPAPSPKAEKSPGWFYLIDVRPSYERTFEMPNDAWLPFDRGTDLKAFLGEIEKLTHGNKDAHIVLYCFFQMHSGPAGQFLASQGYTHVYSLINGTTDWSEYRAPNGR